MNNVEKKEYRLENLSCANCARKFENNIKSLPTVQEATVNFGAAKVSVIGWMEIDFLGCFTSNRYWWIFTWCSQKQKDCLILVNI